MKTTSPCESPVTDSPGSVPALDRSLDILEILSGSTSGLTLSELSSALDFPKNAVFRITQTLLARGYISRDEKLAFHLTQQLLRLAPPRWGSVSLPAISQEVMATLRDETGETVQLGVLSGLEGIIIDQVESMEALRIVVDLGLRFPLYNNAPGKLLLAHMPNVERLTALKQIKLKARHPGRSPTRTSCCANACASCIKAIRWTTRKPMKAFIAWPHQFLRANMSWVPCGSRVPPNACQRVGLKNWVHRGRLRGNGLAMRLRWRGDVESRHIRDAAVQRNLWRRRPAVAALSRAK